MVFLATFPNTLLNLFSSNNAIIIHLKELFFFDYNLTQEMGLAMRARIQVGIT